MLVVLCLSVCVRACVLVCMCVCVCFDCCGDVYVQAHSRVCVCPPLSPLFENPSKQAREPILLLVVYRWQTQGYRSRYGRPARTRTCTCACTRTSTHFSSFAAGTCGSKCRPFKRMGVV
ncbi:MAG: hypothetical protein P4L40_14580 [Terracidiphilus sp.]|nr:hypothetical protein [Terracidiphilus sp.]